ncbi:hypothetical protein ACJJTC_002850 [Scirpophaga incertulas]
MVANQLLEKTNNNTVEAAIVTDTRIPPKLKNQLAQKQKIKTRNDDSDDSAEMAHAGVAVPVTMEELETENKISETSTSNEGISTWILLSNPPNTTVVSTEPTKVEENHKKSKPNLSKNKNKRPQNNKITSAKRPIIGSTNKSDLIASGSAINENVYNKIKDTVLTNVQKNKNNLTQRTTVTSSTTTTTTIAPVIEEVSSTKDISTKPPPPVIPIVKVTSKPNKKKNKNKTKTTTTPMPISEEIQESALLPMEPKEQEIELEVSTPATTTKKPKRTSTKKKNKTKKRKVTKPKPEAETAITENKTSHNKTKSTKTNKKPATPSGPITTQIYNYLSREVMPSVGVGVLGLASLVGLASYFLYPFSTPVRRTFEVDKKDDLYRNNAEEYANEGNGQLEEEMLGTVLAGMPAHSKQKLNPYAGQTHMNRYPMKKEQDIRYRHVAAGYDQNYNMRYPQQKTGIAHGAIYSKPVNYGPQQYETRNVYTTESKYVYEKSPAAYTPYPVVEPIYAAPQTGPSAVSSYSNDATNSVVYGVKPENSDFRPVYPFEGQIFSETTSSPVTYQPTSMYLGSNNDPQDTDGNNYEENAENDEVDDDNKFVVGNVPKELSESATPAVVPEHGPRNIRRKRSVVNRKRSITRSIEEMLKEANKDVFISNEIDEIPMDPISNLSPSTELTSMTNEMTSTPENKEVVTVYASSVNPTKVDKVPTNAPDSFVESISTIPLNNNKESAIETENENEVETSTKAFRVYEVFSTNPTEMDHFGQQVELTTQTRNMMTETTTELKSETTSTMPPSPSPISDSKRPSTSVFFKPRPTLHPEVITYPPLNQDGGFFSFLKRLVEFKYRLGLSILQTTSDNLNRYLRSMENTVEKVSKASASKKNL